MLISGFLTGARLDQPLPDVLGGFRAPANAEAGGGAWRVHVDGDADPATKTPPCAAWIRPKFAPGWRVATNP